MHSVSSDASKGDRLYCATDLNFERLKVVKRTSHTTM